MPRVHFVKKARKAQPAHGIKVGEPYYWWSFFRGPKCVSRERPTQSQLTQSPHKQAIYGMQESMGDIGMTNNVPRSGDDFDAAKETVDDQLEYMVTTLEELRETAEESYNNMEAEGLEYSPVGESLQERIDGTQQALDSVEEAKNEVENICPEDYQIDNPDYDEEEAPDEPEMVFDADSAVDDVTNALGCIDIDSALEGF